MTTFVLPDNEISIATIEKIVKNGCSLSLSEPTEKKIKEIALLIEKNQLPIKLPNFAINSGFSEIPDQQFTKTDHQKLQYNLIVSNACGTGTSIPLPVAKLFLFFKIQSLCSNLQNGVSLEVLKRLIDFYNHQLYPQVFEEGYAGPLDDVVANAHLALPLIGLGKTFFEGKEEDASGILKKLNWKPIKLGSTDGFALLEGNEFSLAFCTHILLKTKKLSDWSDIIASLSYDAFEANKNVASLSLKHIHPKNGYYETLKKLQYFLKNSKILAKTKKHGADPYSFKGIPQVHGALKDLLQFVEQNLESTWQAEIKDLTTSTDLDLTDFPQFNGIPLKQSMDYLGMSVAQLGNLSERRISHLLAGKRGLPLKLINNPGLHTGLGTTHFVAISLINQNRLLSIPSSLDLKSNALGKEDQLITGSGGPAKTLRVIENVEKILSIEMLNAIQAMEFRKPQETSKELQPLIEKFRKKVPHLRQDTIMEDCLKNALLFIQEAPSY